MTVLELKELLEGLDDDMMVLIPMGMEFDGMFYSPCVEESGPTQMGTNEDDADKDEIELLINPPEQEEALLLVPCGFISDEEHKINPELN